MTYLFNAKWIFRGLDRHAGLPSLLGADLAGVVLAFVSSGEMSALCLSIDIAADLLVVTIRKA